MTMQPWQYQAQIKPEEVVDGDTLDVTIDLGFGILLTNDEARVRLRRVDTHEIFGVSHDSEEYKTGIAQKQFVQDWVRNAGNEKWPFLIETHKDDERGKYGRWLAVIKRRKDGAVLNDDLVTAFGDEIRSQ